MWYVYMLLCKDKSIYTGVTNDPQKRLYMHKIGRGGHYTRSRGEVRILYLEKFRTKSMALKREISIKKLRREKKIKLIRNRHLPG